MKYKTLKNSVTSKLRAAKLKFLGEVSLLGRNPRVVWRRLNLMMGRSKGKHIGSLMVEGRELNSSTDKAEAFNRFFSTCVNEEGQDQDTTQISQAHVAIISSLRVLTRKLLTGT